MTKLLSTAALALALATSGAAHATEDFCAVVLKPPAKVTRDKKYNPEAWLALRDGPGMKFMVMGKLREGDLLLASTGGSCKELDGKEICDEKGEWIHIIGIPRFDGPDDSDKTYKDYSRGWVHRKYVQTFLCESQQAEQYVPSLPPPPTAK
jgi:hypothetical protein